MEQEGRVLLINDLVEADEKPYTCIGRNKLNAAEGTMTLNVTCMLDLYCHISVFCRSILFVLASSSFFGFSLSLSVL